MSDILKSDTKRAVSLWNKRGSDSGLEKLFKKGQDKANELKKEAQKFKEKGEKAKEEASALQQKVTDVKDQATALLNSGDEEGVALLDSYAAGLSSQAAKLGEEADAMAAKAATPPTFAVYMDQIAALEDRSPQYKRKMRAELSRKIAGAPDISEEEKAQLIAVLSGQTAAKASTRVGTSLAAQFDPTDTDWKNPNTPSLTLRNTVTPSDESEVTAQQMILMQNGGWPTATTDLGPIHIRIKNKTTR